MRHHAVPLLALFTAAAHAQVAIDGVGFIDRGATGEITLGPIGAGPCALDIDNDGWTDLLLRDGVGQLARLFHNVPDPARPGARTFVDITPATSLSDFTGVAATPQNALAADFDNDGWTDVYLMGRRTIESTSGRLYRNTGALGFIDVTAAAGVAADGDDPESASWCDYDLDGHVDLLVISRAGGVHPWRLLRNRGDGGFDDVTAAVLPAPNAWSRMYSHTWSDVDADGFPDCYLLPSTGPILLLNTAAADGSRLLIDAAAARGYTYLGPAPMGISAADYDNDGDFDVGLSNALVGVTYENTGGQLVRRTLFDSIFAWGTLWLDVDNDRLLDHYQAGSVGRSPNHNKLFLNRGGGTFDDISAALNDLSVYSQHALQLDFNNDGRQDIITTNPYNTPVFVSVNENVSTTTHAWIKVRARGDGGRVNADAIGAVIRVRAGGVTQSREVASGSSTSSTDEFRQHFGLGAAVAVDEIEITWPRTGTLADRTDRFPGPFPLNTTVELHPRARCAADLTGDGAATSADFFAFLTAFFELDPLADVNRDALVDSRDFFDYIESFFAGCPR